MPYIKYDDRYCIDRGRDPETAGELNYLLSRLAIDYFKSNGANYQAINDVVGALAGALAEFQRRLVAPYEDRKAADNGDLPWPS